MITIRNPKEIDIEKIELGKPVSKRFGKFEYDEVPLSYLGGDLVIKTPTIFTYGIKLDEAKYVSHTNSLKINEEGKRNKDF